MSFDLTKPVVYSYRYDYVYDPEDELRDSLVLYRYQEIMRQGGEVVATTIYINNRPMMIMPDDVIFSEYHDYPPRIKCHVEIKRLERHRQHVGHVNVLFPDPFVCSH